MAAATVTNRAERVFGNRRIVTATVSANNNDTWATGFKKIDVCIFTGGAGGARAIGQTLSGGTVTIKTAGGATDPETGIDALIIGVA